MQFLMRSPAATESARVARVGQGGGTALVSERCPDGRVEAGEVRDGTEVHVREIVGGQMLALVVLESLREARPRIAKTHIRAVVSAAGDAVESEHGENLKRRIVDCARRPRVAGQLTARTVVRLRAENPGAGRVDLPIVSDYVADDVVGECRHDVVAGCVKSLREMRRAVESFLLAGVRNEDHRCFVTAREMLV